MKLYKYDADSMKYDECSNFEISLKSLFIITFLTALLTSFFIYFVNITEVAILKDDVINKEQQINELKKELELYRKLDKSEQALKEHKNDVDDFSEENLISFMKKIKLKHPQIALSQAKLETSNFKSKIFLYNNNLFGMKVAKVRGTVNTGENRGHAKYDNWRDSVLDYLIWQKYCADYDDEKKYIEKINAIYAEDVNYIDKVKHIKNESTQNKRRKKIESSSFFRISKDKSDDRMVYTLRNRFNRDSYN